MCGVEDADVVGFEELGEVDLVEAALDELEEALLLLFVGLDALVEELELFEEEGFLFGGADAGAEGGLGAAEVLEALVLEAAVAVELALDGGLDELDLVLEGLDLGAVGALGLAGLDELLAQVDVALCEAGEGGGVHEGGEGAGVEVGVFELVAVDDGGELLGEVGGVEALALGDGELLAEAVELFADDLLLLGGVGVEAQVSGGRGVGGGAGGGGRGVGGLLDEVLEALAGLGELEVVGGVLLFEPLEGLVHGLDAAVDVLVAVGGGDAVGDEGGDLGVGVADADGEHAGVLDGLDGEHAQEVLDGVDGFEGVGEGGLVLNMG